MLAKSPKLSFVFDEDSAKLIKDLAVYAIVMETDVFQHYPSFGFKHAIFSGSIVSDSTISHFLRNEIMSSAVQQFLDEWVRTCLEIQNYCKAEKDSINRKKCR